MNVRFRVDGVVLHGRVIDSFDNGWVQVEVDRSTPKAEAMANRALGGAVTRLLPADAIIEWGATDAG